MTYFSKNKAYLTEELYYTIFRRGKRIIFAPCNELKKIQKYFKKALEWTYPLKTTTFDCAKIHTGKKWVLKMDIKDFYGSVPYEFIKQAVKNACKKIKYSDVNYYLMISLLNNKLPVGASTSAHIANACFYPVDKRIKAYCKRYEIDYSRYMDDLTFSTDDKITLNMIEKFVREILTNFGYRLNNKKTKYISDNKQQNVLGLVVNNNDARIPKSLRKQLRAMIHNYSIYKKCTSLSVDCKYRAWDEHNISQLKGYLAYIKHSDKKSYDKLMQYAKSLDIEL